MIMLSINDCSTVAINLAWNMCGRLVSTYVHWKQTRRMEGNEIRVFPQIFSRKEITPNSEKGYLHKLVPYVERSNGDNIDVSE